MSPSREEKEMHLWATRPYVENSPTNLMDALGLWPVFNLGDVINEFRGDAQFWWQSAGGTYDMVHNYCRMKYVRNWKKDDLFYHCKANCMATGRGLGGGFAGRVISGVRTNIWGRVTEPDWRDDDEANKCGQLGGDCKKRCARFIPPS